MLREFCATADYGFKKLQGSRSARIVQVWVPLVHSSRLNCLASMHECFSYNSSSMLESSATLRSASEQTALQNMDANAL